MTVIASYSPEYWLNDYAVPAGPVETWDASEFFSSLDEDYRNALVEEMERYSYAIDNEDRFVADPSAPDIVREHKGPFTISLVQED